MYKIAILTVSLSTYFISLGMDNETVTITPYKNAIFHVTTLKSNQDSATISFYAKKNNIIEIVHQQKVPVSDKTWFLKSSVPTFPELLDPTVTCPEINEATIYMNGNDRRITLSHDPNKNGTASDITYSGPYNGPENIILNPDQPELIKPATLLNNLKKVHVFQYFISPQFYQYHAKTIKYERASGVTTKYTSMYYKVQCTKWGLELGLLASASLLFGKLFLR